MYKPTCKTCLYWEGDDDPICRRNPPRIANDAPPFPPSYSHDWCGEHSEFRDWIAYEKTQMEGQDMRAELSDTAYQVEVDGRLVVGRVVCGAVRSCPVTKRLLFLLCFHDTGDLLWVPMSDLRPNVPNPPPSSESQAWQDMVDSMGRLPG